MSVPYGLTLSFIYLSISTVSQDNAMWPIQINSVGSIDVQKLRQLI